MAKTSVTAAAIAGWQVESLWILPVQRSNKRWVRFYLIAYHGQSIPMRIARSQVET